MKKVRAYRMSKDAEKRVNALLNKAAMKANVRTRDHYFGQPRPDPEDRAATWNRYFHDLLHLEKYRRGLCTRVPGKQLAVR